MSIKVLVVDDHAVVRQGLQTYLSLNGEIEITGMASSGPDALKLLHEQSKNAEPLPDIAVVDLYMPGMDGFATIEALGREFPTVKVVVLTNSLQESELLRALQLRVSGFLLKNYEVALVAKTIKAVSAAKNMVQLPNEAVQMLVDRITQNTLNGKPSPDILSERERKILIHLAEGRANKEIAYLLEISEGTVKTQVSIILAKLGLSGRTQAAVYVNSFGLLPVETN